MTKLAVVTGGTRGLGRAISSRLSREGLELVLVYLRDELAAQETQKELAAAGGKISTIQADVSDPESMQRLADRLGERGGADILVHSAFRSGRKPKKTHEVSPAEFSEDLATNLTGAFVVARAVLPGMMNKGFGRIVFLGSLASRGEPGRVAYSVAKNGLVGLTRTIAKEYARSGITANVVSPGFIDAGAFLKLPGDIRERALATVPSKRAGTADEVAEAVWYLVGPQSGYVTGQVISIDGGSS